MTATSGQLILYIHPEDAVSIGDDILVQAIRDGENVRIYIKAPKETQIKRIRSHTPTAKAVHGRLRSR